MDNANSMDYLNKIKNQVIENLSRTKFGPSVQMTDVPRDPEGLDDEADAALDDEDEDENKDARMTQHRWDKHIEHEGELSESEDEAENERNGIVNKKPIRRRNIMDYQNPHAVPDIDDSGVATPASVTNGEPAALLNSRIQEGLLAAKVSASPNGQRISSPSIESQAGDDVQMGEDGTADGFEAPFEAPPPAQQPLGAAPDIDMAEDDAGPLHKLQGQEERTTADAEGEARTEAAS